MLLHGHGRSNLSERPGVGRPPRAGFRRSEDLHVLIQTESGSSGKTVARTETGNPENVHLLHFSPPRQDSPVRLSARSHPQRRPIKRTGQSYTLPFLPDLPNVQRQRLPMATSINGTTLLGTYRERHKHRSSHSSMQYPSKAPRKIPLSGPNSDGGHCHIKNKYRPFWQKLVEYGGPRT